jgi:hypothetical protein
VPCMRITTDKDVRGRVRGMMEQGARCGSMRGEFMGEHEFNLFEWKEMGWFIRCVRRVGVIEVKSRFININYIVRIHLLFFFDAGY